MYLGEKTVVCEFIVAIGIIPTTNPLIDPKNVPLRPFNWISIRRFQQFPVGWIKYNETCIKSVIKMVLYLLYQSQEMRSPPERTTVKIPLSLQNFEERFAVYLASSTANSCFVLNTIFFAGAILLDDDYNGNCNGVMMASEGALFFIRKWVGSYYFLKYLYVENWINKGYVCYYKQNNIFEILYFFWKKV